MIENFTVDPENQNSMRDMYLRGLSDESDLKNIVVITDLSKDFPYVSSVFDEVFHTLQNGLDVSPITLKSDFDVWSLFPPISEEKPFGEVSPDVLVFDHVSIKHDDQGKLVECFQSAVRGSNSKYIVLPHVDKLDNPNLVINVSTVQFDGFQRLSTTAPSPEYTVLGKV